MEVLTFSQTRGITALFQGYGDKAYVIMSTFYGFVGYADIDKACIGKDKVHVDLYLCNDCKSWYWSLKQIVMRGIRKAERTFVSTKKVDIDVHYLDRFVDGKPCYDKSLGNVTVTCDMSHVEEVKE